LNGSLDQFEEDLDEGVPLVIRRAFSGLATQDDFEQREAIFHTRCTMSEEVFYLIIDGGSCPNVTSQSMVEQLKLVVCPHSKPYIIRWLNQGKGLPISSQCLLCLSIGKITRMMFAVI